MKFGTLLDFYNWLTISTGCLQQDFSSLQVYMASNDFRLLNDNQRDIFFSYMWIVKKLDLEQQE